MARKPQGGTSRSAAKVSTSRKRSSTKASAIPAGARSLGIDDLIGEFSSAPAVPAPEADLDALLDSLIAPPEAPAETDLDALLADLAEPEPPSEPPAEDSAFDDLLAELAPISEAEAAPAEPASDIDALPDDPATPASGAPDDLDALLEDLATPPADDFDALLDAVVETAPPPPAVDPLDDLIGELDEPAPPVRAPARESIDDLVADAPPDEDGIEPADDAIADAAPAAPPPRKARKLPRPSLPRLPRLVLAGGLATLFVVSNGVSYTLGARTRPPAPPPVVIHAKPAEGLDRFVGEGLDFRIDDKTFFEDDIFRAAVDELVGGPDVQGRLAEMMPRMRADGPIRRGGARIRVRACNPQACGQDNFVVEYDTANKQVSACFTQPYVDPETGEPTRATSWLYDEKGSREVPACEGYPHPTGPVALPPGEGVPAAASEAAAEEAEAEPADIVIHGPDAPGATQTLAERIHAQLASRRRARGGGDRPEPAEE
ncbi:MAG: hypothetical protein RIS94_2847 [Pseudomonadota bacterium]|jgi:hypothetical protein